MTNVAPDTAPQPPSKRIPPAGPDLLVDELKASHRACTREIETEAAGA